MQIISMVDPSQNNKFDNSIITNTTNMKIISFYPVSEGSFKNIANGSENITLNPQDMLIIIDLGKTMPIYQINFYNRKDCCSNRSTGMIVMLTNSIDKAQEEYKSNPFPNKDGTTNLNHEDINNQSNYWGGFTVFPPNPKVYGFSLGSKPANALKTETIKLENIISKKQRNWTTFKHLSCI